MLRAAPFAFALLVLPATSCAGPRPTAPAAQSETLFLDGFFPIGVFSQPVESFEKWKQRGIDTLLEVPMNHDPAAWDRAARSGGFRIIRRPAANPQDDIGRKDLLAWSHWDEPDAAGRAPAWTPTFERTYAEWRRIDPNRQIFLNFAGPDITWFATRTDAYSREYATYYPRLVRTADWIASDIYPAGGWLNRAHESRRGDITLIAEPMRAIRKLTNKPQFVFIEASEIESGNVPGARCPTPAEMRAQIWYAILHGARGIFYFPASVRRDAFRFDAAPPEIVAEMVRQNALIRKAGRTLQGPVNPSGIQVSADKPLEVGWRLLDGQATVIVVNPTRSSVPNAKITIKAATGEARFLSDDRRVPVANGVLRESVEPLGVRVFVVKVAG